MICKSLIKTKTLEYIYEKHWSKTLKVFVYLFAQNLNFSFDKLLPKLFELKIQATTQLVIGLDVLSEMLRLGK